MTSPTKPMWLWVGRTIVKFITIKGRILAHRTMPNCIWIIILCSIETRMEIEKFLFPPSLSVRLRIPPTVEEICGDGKCVAISKGCESATFKHKDENLTAQDLKTIAMNIYFEARNEPYYGQVAVGYNVLNRCHEKYQSCRGKINEIVYAAPNGVAAYSWTKEKHGGVHDMQSWDRAVNIARSVGKGEPMDTTCGATFYYNPNVVYSPFHESLKQKGYTDIVADPHSLHVFQTNKPKL